MKTFPLLLFSAALLVGAFVGDVAAMDDNPFGGDGDATVNFDAENRVNVVLVSNVPSERENTTVSATPVCGKWGGYWVYDGDGNPVYWVPVCDWYWRCGGERIDDVFTGRISGPEGPAAYAEYLGERTDLINWILDTLSLWWNSPDVDPEDVSEHIIDSFLGEPASALEIPVFYYCRKGDDGPLETGSYDAVTNPWGVLFEWDTDVATEYDITTVRNTIIDELHELMEFHEPELRAIPPLEGGFTYVRFPMWLWLHEPVEAKLLWAESDLSTIRLAARARLDYIEWNLGDDVTIDCTLEEMRAYVGPDPTSDPPPCHHIFDELEDFELTATAHYDIQEQISFRLNSAVPYPAAPWIPHPTTPTISVTGTAGVIEVHELVALNVVATDG